MFYLPRGPDKNKISSLTWLRQIKEMAIKFVNYDENM